ncbi:MAG TPA: Hsp33 family molecular chaperone HslO [Spirochaetota bacterium]|nr:Hsp33 family molecular chaperone HslO [Spirochaetota bacterium]
MDMISRIYCAELKLRAYTVTSLETAREVTSIHKTTPNATVALGRTISAAALLSATLKPETSQSILLKFSGEGPLKEVHVQADAFGNLRGYIANPSIDVTDPIGRISFSKAIGAGLLTVIKDIGMKEPYNSVTPILYGEIAQDLAYYLVTSEQIPSAVIIGLNLGHEGEITSSGGILIQTFPDTEESVIGMIEENIQNMKADLGDRLESGENIYGIVQELFNNRHTEIMSATPLVHKCRCSHETLLRLMKTLDKSDIHEMIEKDGGASVTCTFCLKEYKFTPEELKGVHS